MIYYKCDFCGKTYTKDCYDNFKSLCCERMRTFQDQLLIDKLKSRGYNVECLKKIVTISETGIEIHNKLKGNKGYVGIRYDDKWIYLYFNDKEKGFLLTKNLFDFKPDIYCNRINNYNVGCHYDTKEMLINDTD